MILRFSKYHGTGNDFIMVDNRSSVIRKSETSTELIARLCNRHLAIGADGLILINNSRSTDFEMVYFNSDGREGTMCGNGGRCAVAFADSLRLIKEKVTFSAVDGVHEAFILSKERDVIFVKLKMQDVNNIIKTGSDFIIDTGSPHLVRFLNNVDELDVIHEGRKIRNSSPFKEQGINVNFAEVLNDEIFVRTYERGVEDETLSCGTGSTATALAAYLSGFCKSNDRCKIRTNGGDLLVNFNKVSETSFNEIWLSGTAINAFKGEINI